MPGLKRDSLLSDLERERLTKRETLDRHTRTTNDIRVKRKLAAWLENISDVMLILKHLPTDQSQRVITDDHIFHLLAIIDDAMRIDQFAPVEGDIENPEKWVAGKRPARELDILRAYRLHDPLQFLSRFYVKPGSTNPIDKISLLMMMKADPRYKARINDAELKGLTIIEKALKTHSLEI
jgi:hypothetical protein